MLRQVRRFFENHGEGRFTWWHRGADAPYLPLHETAKLLRGFGIQPTATAATASA